MRTGNWRRAVPLVALVAAACVSTNPPADDSTAPVIALTPMEQPSHLFRSTDARPSTSDSCVSLSLFPARFSVTVRDEGGVAGATVRVFPGQISRSSVSLAPAAPGSSFEIRREYGGDLLQVRLHPDEGSVHTSMLAVFDVIVEQPPCAISVTAVDYQGNDTRLEQVDIRPMADGTLCKNR